MLGEAGGAGRCSEAGGEMNIARTRAFLVAAILLVIVALIGVNIFLPPSGQVVAIEEAGLIGALISALMAAVGYYFGKD